MTACQRALRRGSSWFFKSPSSSGYIKTSCRLSPKDAYPRSVPSQAKPTFSRTRCDAAFQGSTVALDPGDARVVGQGPPAEKSRGVLSEARVALFRDDPRTRLGGSRRSRMS